MRTPQTDFIVWPGGKAPMDAGVLARHAAVSRPVMTDSDRRAVIDGCAERPLAVDVVERVTVRGVVWQIRCGGCYVNVDGRLIEIGSGTVTTETVTALVEALRVAAAIAEPTT